MFYRLPLLPSQCTFAPAADSSAKWNLTENTQMTVKCSWKHWGLFSGGSQAAGHVYPTALLDSPWLLRIHYWLVSVIGSHWFTEPVLMNSVRTIINGLLSNLLLKFQLLMIDGPIVTAALKAAFYFHPKGSLFPAFLFISSVWLVTHIRFSEKFKSLKSQSYVEWCPVFFWILWWGLHLNLFY